VKHETHVEGILSWTRACSDLRTMLCTRGLVSKDNKLRNVATKLKRMRLKACMVEASDGVIIKSL
jgi:hypothetical protein